MTPRDPEIRETSEGKYQVWCPIDGTPDGWYHCGLTYQEFKDAYFARLHEIERLRHTKTEVEILRDRVAQLERKVETLAGENERLKSAIVAARKALEAQ